MNKADFEIKSLVVITLICYCLNFIFTSIGFLYNQDYGFELLHYRIANAFAMSASVMATRYTGARGQHIAASGYALLGITHGISFATLGSEGINGDKGITMVIPMIPAFIFIFWCSLYPVWLRVAGVVPIILFTLVYLNVQSGGSYFGWALSSGYASLQIIEVIWGIYLFRDWKLSRK